jgi:hypothetical protein
MSIWDKRPAGGKGSTPGMGGNPPRPQDRPGENGARLESQPQEQFDPQQSAALLMTPTSQRMIGKKEIREAAETLKKYKDGKSNFEKRIIDEEEWWRLRQSEVLRKQKRSAQRDRMEREEPDVNAPEPNSAWTFNSITNKHADWMDNFPECSVLPREPSDQQDATVLSEILSVIDERYDYEKVWSDTGWYMLKHGVAAEGTFWDQTLENGMGDVTTVMIDMLNLFWEPGITDLQESRNLFITKLVPTATLEEQYPQLKGKLGGSGVITPSDYLYDDTVDNTDKSVVVDWYYKKQAANGRTLLHYCKFVGDEVLFASENEEEYTERGWYDHGRYPVALKVMYPDSGTVTGFGIIAVCRDPQTYIDKLGGYILQHAMMCSRPRYWASASMGVNRRQFLDWNEPVVEVQGTISEEKLVPITVPSMSDEVRYFYQLKIDELKETSSNRDVSNGSTSSGVTAAAAISALQEAGNKGSRDFLTGGYRAYRETNYLRIELIRQFYTEQREFRITGQQPGENYRFVQYSSVGIQDQQVGVDSYGNPLYRRPVFDLTVKAQKRNPYSKMQQMEYAKEFYASGMFNPENAQAATIALNMMDFEGRDEVLADVTQGQTLLNICQQMQQQVQQLQAQLAVLTGQGVPQTAAAAQAASGGSQKSSGQSRGSTASRAVDSGVGTSMTDYGQRLAARAVPDMNQVNQSTTQVGSTNKG